MAKSTKSAKQSKSERNVNATAARGMRTGSKPGVAPVRTVHAKADKVEKSAVATTGKKIGKPAAKSADKAKGKGAKPAAKAKRESSGARNSYADKAIKVLIKPDDAGYRGGRAARFALVAAAKNTNDVLGKSWKAGDKSGEITGANLRVFVEAGCIELS